MDYAIEDAAETAGRRVVVRMAGIFSEPQLLVDGSPLAATDGKFVLPAPATAEAGKPAEIRLRTPLLDFVPIVEIDGRRVEIAPPLPSWTYFWCLIPTILLLVFARGILPGLLGLAFSYFGLYQLRAAAPNRRFLWSTLFNAATIAFVVAMQLARHHHGVASHP